MATWFGKYNNDGYAVVENGSGSASDHITRKKRKNMFSTVYFQVSELGEDVNQKISDIKVDDDLRLKYASSFDTLYNVKKGQSHVAYDCEDDENYFIAVKTGAFNPDPCFPSTYDLSNNLDYDNADCSNQYQGILLVDENGDPINSTITNNTIYAEIKDVSYSDIPYQWTSERESITPKVYFNIFGDDC